MVIICEQFACFPVRIVHQRIVELTITSAGNWQWSLLMTPTDLDILVVIFFTWPLKESFLSSVRPRNLIVETYIGIESRIVISNAFF